MTDYVRISDLPNGNHIQPGDLILAERNGHAISLPGAAFATASDFRPPAAAGFPHGSWGNGATAGAMLADLSAGLQISAPANGTGVMLATRPIPTQYQTQFQMTARISYSGLNSNVNYVSGVGLALSTGATGSAAQSVTFTRFRNGVAALGPMVSNWTGSTAIDLYGTSAIITSQWYRVTLSGTAFTLSLSDEGVNWFDVYTHDLGLSFTEYGFMISRKYATATGMGLCTYFDSSELPYTRF